MNSAVEVQRAYAQALLVDLSALQCYQQDNDALMASQKFKEVFLTDVQPVLAMARFRSAGAINPIACFRAYGYQNPVATQPPAMRRATGS